MFVSDFQDENARDSWINRWTAGPPSYVSMLMILILAVCILWALSSSFAVIFPQPLAGCFIWPAAIALAMDYLIRLARPIARHCFLHHTLRWAVLPAAIIIVVLSARTQWPLRMRFDLNRSALQATAEQLLQRSATDVVTPVATNSESIFPEFEWFGQTVGGYRVEFACVMSAENVVLIQTGGFFRSGWGFAYAPAGRTPKIRDIDVFPLAQNWWAFYYVKP